MKYKKNNDLIVAFENGDTSGYVNGADLSGEWLETDKDIKSVRGKFYFTDSEEYQQALAQQQAEEQAITEEEALKPTVEDLAEALDILTNIVLGGE